LTVTLTETAVPPRSAIPHDETWNAESVFPDVAAWAAEAESLSAAIAAVQQHAGHLGDGPQALLAGVDAVDGLMERLGRLLSYVNMDHNVDTSDQDAARRYGQAQGIVGQALAAVGFLDPELLAIGRETLDRWLQEEPRLAIYRQYIDDLFRRQAHVRSSEVEQLLGLLAEPFGGPYTTQNFLVNADFQFKPARDSQGGEVALTQGNYQTLLHSAERETRRTAYESYTDEFLAHQNTLASNLAASIKQNVFNMRARNYPSTLEASLFANNVPVAVFHNLVETFRRNLPTWHRYWAVRRRALGYETLHAYDIKAPLTGDQPTVTYPQAVDMIAAGMAPLGEEYVGLLRRGCLEDRWVDFRPNQGKTDGAFSAGSRGTHPFILMSYDDSLGAMSTLAHELGHSLHSYYTWQNQPNIYSGYSLFVAEVASNFNQAMTRAHLLAQDPARGLRITIIEEAMSNFHRYFFIMPTLARFELETHQRLERGQGLTAADMNGLMADLFAEGYGDELAADRERTGITWATFGHLYADYYVYQYATGIAAAHALANRILAGTAGAAGDYLRFLKAGSSVYPLDALKLAGVDMTQPAAVEAAFEVLAGYVGQLEELFQ
jgi:oligoendopeptidase F